MKLIKWIIICATVQCLNAQVVINEFMASNTTIIKDNAGEYDDWIELYNKSSVAVDISSWSLTDSLLDLRKWKFKRPTVIPANGYFIVWADEDSSQGSTFHANFKLSAKGEIIVLVDSLKKIVDSITYGTQITDKSSSRVPNGTGNFIIATPTYNAANGTTSVISKSDNAGSWRFNEETKSLWYSKSNVEEKAYVITNAIGRVVKKGFAEKQQIELGSILPGIYFLRTETDVLTFMISE